MRVHGRVVALGWVDAEVERYGMGTRIRSVEEGPDGALWVLEDGRRDGAEGRLLRLTPKN